VNYGHYSVMATDLRRAPAALDPGSFDLFYRRHLGEIYRFVLNDVGNKADAEEVTQTAFLDAFRALRRGHEPDMPRAWMYGIARNATRRRYRTLSRRPREVELDEQVVEEIAQPDAGPFAQAVQGAFGRLRDSHRDVLFLREVEGLSYAEIASRLSLSQSAVETLLFRARRALREHLEAEGLQPAVRRGSVQSFKALALLPAAFMGRLSERMQHLLSPELATKTAGAVTAVALGAGVAVGTQALPVDLPARAQASESAPLAPAASVPWSVGLSEWAMPTADVRARADRKKRADGREGRGESRGDGPRGGESGSGPRGGEGKPGDGASGSGSGGSGGGDGGGILTVPPISLPAVQVPQVPSVPVPPVSVPSVEVPGTDVAGGLAGG
jgi:RNA polymerase sigma factor (sigma-70 family)